MRRLVSVVGTTMLLLAASGAAKAGHWEVVYDLLGSTVTTNVPAASLTDVDPLTGTFTLHFDVATAAAPITGVRLWEGNYTLNVSQTNGAIFLLTGTVNTVLSPGTFGTPGVISAPNVTLSTVADTSATGFLHCGNGLFNCTSVGMVASAMQPQTPTGPGPFPLVLPKFVFTGGVGVSDFTSTPATVVIPPGPSFGATVTLITTYVGKELSRAYHVYYVPEPARWMQLTAGAALLVCLSLWRGRKSGHLQRT